jgi:hypothetical protein
MISEDRVGAFFTILALALQQRLSIAFLGSGFSRPRCQRGEFRLGGPD